MNGLKIKEVESITVAVKTEDDAEYEIVYNEPSDVDVMHALDYSYTSKMKTNISFCAGSIELINMPREKQIKTEVNVSKYFELFE